MYKLLNNGVADRYLDEAKTGQMAGLQELNKVFKRTLSCLRSPKKQFKRTVRCSNSPSLKAPQKMPK